MFFWQGLFIMRGTINIFKSYFRPGVLCPERQPFRMAVFLPIFRETNETPAYGLERRIMTFCQFIQVIEAKVKEEVQEDFLVSVYKARKNNGVIRTGLMIEEKGINVSPTIYLEEYYEQYQCGNSLDYIASDIVSLYSRIRFQKPWKSEGFRRYEDVEEKIVFRLINRNANEEMLKTVPYVPYLDLAIVFYVLLEMDPCGTASMLIQNIHLSLWGITKEELYGTAMVRTPELLPSDFRSMESVIEELADQPQPPKKGEMYVLSNQIRSFGAAVILYPGRLKRVAALLGESYYILPSSVHEVIIVPEREVPGVSVLNEMITEINEIHVEPEEVLADHAYYYSHASGELML